MATTYVHTRMGIIDASGDTYILYPQNTAADVSVSRANNSEIPSTVTNVQLLADALAASAFAIPIDDTSTTSTTKSWSANKINSELSQLNSNLINSIYPVGAIFITVNNTNPGTYITGTTWVLLKDRFLLGAGDTYTAGNTGGEATHTLTVNEMPSHYHGIGFLAQARSTAGPFSWDQAPFYATTTGTASAFGSTNNTGGGQAHNNMPPYLVVYMWKRTK